MYARPPSRNHSIQAPCPAQTPSFSAAPAPHGGTRPSLTSQVTWVLAGPWASGSQLSKKYWKPGSPLNLPSALRLRLASIHSPRLALKSVPACVPVVPCASATWRFTAHPGPLSVEDLRGLSPLHGVFQLPESLDLPFLLALTARGLGLHQPSGAFPCTVEFEEPSPRASSLGSSSSSLTAVAPSPGAPESQGSGRPYLPTLGSPFWVCCPQLRPRRQDWP